jgi:phosphopantothenoylcysteine synthetase/decarboxylase
MISIAAKCLMVPIERISSGTLHEWKSEANESGSSKMAFSILNAEKNYWAERASIRSELTSLNPYLIEHFGGKAT